MASEAIYVYIDLTESIIQSESDSELVENSGNGSEHASDCSVVSSDSEDKR